MPIVCIRLVPITGSEFSFFCEIGQSNDMLILLVAIRLLKYIFNIGNYHSTDYLQSVFLVVIAYSYIH